MQGSKIILKIKFLLLNEILQFLSVVHNHSEKNQFEAGTSLGESRLLRLPTAGGVLSNWVSYVSTEKEREKERESVSLSEGETIRPY